jgi:hypothetical protein
MAELTLNENLMRTQTVHDPCVAPRRRTRLEEPPREPPWAVQITIR